MDNQNNAQAKNVIIYSTPTCHFCHLAKDFFNENGVKYVEYDVLSNLEKRQEMLEKSGQMGVPVISIDNQIIVGFDQTKVSSLLGI